MTDPLPAPATLPETWDMPTSSAAIFPKAESDRLEKLLCLVGSNEERVRVLRNDGCRRWLRNDSAR
jgi:hypothetical protein